MTPYDAAALAAVSEDSPEFAKVQAKLAHELVCAAKRGDLPKLYSTDGQGDDAIARMKFFTPWGDWTWYVLEFDGADECFGLVQGFEEELGAFSLAEMEASRGPHGLRVERDLHFTPRPLKEVRKKTRW
jgi:hypothetical protein